MRDNGMKLKDKTVLLLGPVRVLVQNLATHLTDLGADVAMVHEDVKEAQRFANVLSDAREVREDHGRAAAIEAKIESRDQARDVISRVAEAFGSLDVLIDVRLTDINKNNWKPEEFCEVASTLPEHLKASAAIFAETQGFLIKRQRGRMIWLSQERLLRKVTDAPEADASTGFSGLARHLASGGHNKNLTFNCIELGLTEEFLRTQSPKSPSVEAARQALGSKIPQSRLLDSSEISQFISFVASPLSSALNGQTVHLG